MDHYYTISQPATGEYKEKGSKFISYVFPLENEQQFQDYLEHVKSEHPKARHYCYAYKIGLKGDIFRINDDGEPSGTAGKPIWGQIQSFGVSDVLVIVIRYFGGTKLGVPGLIHAYKSAAMEALVQAGKIEKVLFDQYKLFFPLSEMGHVYHVLKSLELSVIESDYGENSSITFQIRKGDAQNTLLLLKAGLLKIPLDFAGNTKGWGVFDVQ